MMQKILLPIVTVGLIGLVTSVGLSTAAQYEAPAAQPQKVSSSNTNSIDVLAEGDALRANGDYEGARDAYAKAAQEFGGAEAHLRLAGMHMVANDYTAAIKTFQTAIGFDSDNHKAFVGLAVAYLHGGNYILAEAALNEAKKRAPAKSTEIDEVLAWVKRRSANMQAGLAGHNGSEASMGMSAHPPLKESGK